MIKDQKDTGLMSRAAVSLFHNLTSLTQGNEENGTR